MPSRKGLDQALVWLKSKMAERDTLDAINAEICYNVIMDLKDKRKVIGALYHQAYTELKHERNKKEKLDDLEKASRQDALYLDRLKTAVYTSSEPQLDDYERLGYTRIQMNERNLEDTFDRGDEC